MLVALVMQAKQHLILESMLAVTLAVKAVLVALAADRAAKVALVAQAVMEAVDKMEPPALLPTP